MQRRQFIAGIAAGASLGLAGCLGGQSDGTTAEPTTQETTRTTRSTTDAGAQLGDDRTLDVVGTDATAFVVTREDSEPRVQSQRNARQVLVTFAADGIDDPEQFVAENVALTVNGDHEYTDPVFPEGGDASEFDAAYAVPSDVTPYGATVDVDTGDASHSWEFDARDIEAITQEVDYEVTTVSVPDSVAPGRSSAPNSKSPTPATPSSSPRASPPPRTCRGSPPSTCPPARPSRGPWTSPRRPTRATRTTSPWNSTGAPTASSTSSATSDRRP